MGAKTKFRESKLSTTNPFGQLFENNISFQDRFLQDVSRTFALTIPQLPKKLYLSVGNAYLLCRITDTIEDDPVMLPSEKKKFSKQFNSVVKGETDAKDFLEGLLQALSSKTPKGERELIENTENVIKITHSFSTPNRRALERCVEIMSSGMSEFQQTAGAKGLDTITHFTQYCYYVAGVVGEMLTDLFCDYSPKMNKNRDKLQILAKDFGQGLQMTNILKDIWDDRERDICWLPRDVFQEYGIDLEQYSKADNKLIPGIQKLVVIAHGKLKNALQYILLVPSNETGIRQHCLLALGMAVLTLKKINSNPGFKTGGEVKITHRSVKFIYVSTKLLSRSNLLLTIFYKILMSGFHDQDGRAILGALNH